MRNEFWELTLLPRMGQDELLWVNDDVVIVDDASLKPQYWGTYNEE